MVPGHTHRPGDVHPDFRSVSVTPLWPGPGKGHGRTWPCFHSDSWRVLNWEVTVPMQRGIGGDPWLLEGSGGGRGLVPRGESHAGIMGSSHGRPYGASRGACASHTAAGGRNEPEARILAPGLPSFPSLPHWQGPSGIWGGRNFVT